MFRFQTTSPTHSPELPERGCVDAYVGVGDETSVVHGRTSIGWATLRFGVSNHKFGARPVTSVRVDQLQTVERWCRMAT